MADKATSFEVKTYKVFLCDGITPKGWNGEACAAIECRGERGLLSPFFIPDGARGPNWAKGDHGVAYVDASRLAWYVDILRNERPVHAHVDPEHPRRNRLHTGPEPVGEGEQTNEDTVRLLRRVASRAPS